MRAAKIKHPYYNFSKLLSFNATYNFLVGGRGLGKTYGAKKKAIKDALTKDDQFIYLRRYKNELATARNTFFADLIALNAFPNWDFKSHGNLALAAPVSTRDDKKREWKTIGYFIALSTSQTQKSVSFPMVRTIIYDEFIIERGALHYLPDESDVFNNFYSTVDRYQDKTKVFFLANSVSIMNPYFLAYKIRPDESSEFVVMEDRFIVAHFPDCENFSNSVYETKFGKFIKDTDYADYAVGNTFSDNHENLLRLKNSNARYRFTLETKTSKFSIWYDSANNEYYAQAKVPKQQIIFTLAPEKMDDDKTLMTFQDKPLAYLRAAFRAGRVNFDEASTRNNFIGIFKR